MTDKLLIKGLRHGNEYLFGRQSGGCFFGIIEIHSTSELEQKEIKATVGAGKLGTQISSSIEEKLEKVCLDKSTTVTVFRSGGSEPFKTNLDEMIKEAREFPTVVKQEPVAYMGIYKKYKESIRLNAPKEEDSSENQKRRDDLIYLGQEYARLKDLRSDISFVLDNFNNNSEGKGVIFKEYEFIDEQEKEDKLKRLKYDFQKINESLHEVTATARKCREKAIYKIPEKFVLTEALPQITGENMELKKLQKAVNELREQVKELQEENEKLAKIISVDANSVRINGQLEVQGMIKGAGKGVFPEPDVPSFKCAGSGRAVAFKYDLFKDGENKGKWDLQIWGQKENGEWIFKSLGGLGGGGLHSEDRETI